MRNSYLPADLRELDAARRAALRAVSSVVLARYRAIRRGRIFIGSGVIADYRLMIRGPGLVILEDDANLFALPGQTQLSVRKRGAVIRIGRNARVNGAILSADTCIEIGEDCILGEAVLLDTDMHSLARDRRTNRNAPVRSAPIVLEPSVWVARGAAVLPGVRVGEGSVIGYGSVVTRDVPAGVLAAGNPARIIRSLD